MVVRQHQRDEPASGNAGNVWLGSLTRQGMDWRRWLFYIGVPGALAVYGAVNNQHSIEVAGIWPTTWFYFAHSFVPWWTTCASTHLIYIALTRFRPPAPMIWAAGAVLACILMVPYTNWIGTEFPGESSGAGSMTVTTFLIYAGRMMVVWILVNLFFERVVRLPRYRYAVSKMPAGEDDFVAPSPSPAPKTTTRANLPDFLSRAGKMKSIDELYSVSAEEHYVRLHTANGDELIYKRFSDAVQELEALNGFRVHRSHWVSPHGVSGIIRDGKRMYIKLKDGERLPVSRPYQQLVRNHAQACGVKIASRASNPSGVRYH